MILIITILSITTFSMTTLISIIEG
jgi:hypothetical protein